ncbi:MAG: Endonuclease MutS2 [Spirochaetes bacterium ADurb.Bin110]|nr:MAG: Endonuclease MutS2 [Spirochaetes bacterium ADurb.Bin110]
MVTNEHSLTLLDFYRLRKRLEEYCFSHEGRALMNSTLPCSQEDSVKRLKKDLSLLVEGLSDKEMPSFPFPNIEIPIAKALKEGTMLEVDELFAIGLWAKSYQQFFAFLRSIIHSFIEVNHETWGEDLNDDEAWAKLGIENILHSAPALIHAVQIVFAIISEDGEIKDLPRLKALKLAIQKTQAENLRIINRYLSDPALQDALQSNIATERDNRTVIAIKANFKGRIKGIVHEFSSTGQTIFIEPLELVERNNRLLELDSKLNEEIKAILRETTDALRQYLPILMRGREFLAAADVRLARAIQLKREDLAIAGHLDQGIHLYKAKHPLLGKKAVPIDVDIPDGARILIITGPNTGGKTVSLKTIGLLALLNQYGAGISALSTSAFAVFDTILADIGDEQSIDQSLSTFSGHMNVISGIVSSATDRSLVLLDELGAGTDPEEGCAIAMALLDYFHHLQCFTIVSTHHGVLKNYGYTKPGCLNASMEFDAESLSPTYRIIMGVPGESRALEIAGQIGLPKEIVDIAKSYLEDERSDYSVIIHSLGEKQRELEKLESEKKRQLEKVVESRRMVDLENLRIHQRELDLRKQGVAELRHFLTESRRIFENIVRELRENGRKDEDTSAGREFLRKMSDEIHRQSEELESFAEETQRIERLMKPDMQSSMPIDIDKIRSGDTVIFQNREAIFLRMLDEKKALVQLGSLRVPVECEALSLSRSRNKTELVSKPGYQIELASDSMTRKLPVAELDVRGMRLSEALDALEHQIDAASLAGISSFAIIHGTGEGILSRGIHEWLSKQSSVADYYFARPEDGGFGKTWIHLKE